MTANKSWDEYFEHKSKLPSVEVVVRDGERVSVHKLPQLPGVSVHVYEYFCEQLHGLAEVGIDQLGPEDPEMDARIVTTFVIARMSTGTGSNGTGAPDPGRAYAERAGIATWEFARGVFNTSERTSRYAWNRNAAEHLQEAHRSYVQDAWLDALPNLAAESESAKRAFRALRLGNPQATPAELVGMVLSAVSSAIEYPHPEKVPSLMPSY